MDDKFPTLTLKKEALFFILASLTRAQANCIEMMINEKIDEEDILDSTQLIENVINIISQVIDSKKTEREFIKYAYDKFQLIIPESEDGPDTPHGGHTQH